MACITLLAFFIAAAVEWNAAAAEPSESKDVEYVAKPLALALLLLFAATGENPSLWLVAALVFSLLGDVYLMLPSRLFAAGLGAFLVAHVAYIADFDVGLGWRLFWFLAIMVGSYPVATKRILQAVEDPRLRTAVGVYTAVICLMAGSALASGSLVAAAGALLFVASDTLLAWNRFVGPVARAHLIVMITYHLGQLLLVVALRS